MSTLFKNSIGLVLILSLFGCDDDPVITRPDCLLISFSRNFNNYTVNYDKKFRVSTVNQNFDTAIYFYQKSRISKIEIRSSILESEYIFEYPDENTLIITYYRLVPANPASRWIFTLSSDEKPTEIQFFTQIGSDFEPGGSTILTYDLNGDVIQEEFTDSNGNLGYVNEYEYTDIKNPLNRLDFLAVLFPTLIINHNISNHMVEVINNFETYVYLPNAFNYPLDRIRTSPFLQTEFEFGYDCE